MVQIQSEKLLSDGAGRRMTMQKQELQDGFNMNHSERPLRTEATE